MPKSTSISHKGTNKHSNQKKSVPNAHLILVHPFLIGWLIVILAALGFYVYIVAHPQIAANFADNVLRPTLGNQATITGALLAELNITTQWIKMDPVDSFHFPDGSRFTVPSDFDTYLGLLKQEFPEESGNIDQFFALVRKMYLVGLMRYFRNVHTNRISGHLWQIPQI